MTNVQSRGHSKRKKPIKETAKDPLSFTLRCQDYKVTGKIELKDNTPVLTEFNCNNDNPKIASFLKDETTDLLPLISLWANHAKWVEVPPTIYESTKDNKVYQSLSPSEERTLDPLPVTFTLGLNARVYLYRKIRY